MSDDGAREPGQDRSSIRLGEDGEVRYWTSRFGIGEDELRAIVERIGDSAAAVEQYIQGSSSAH